MAGGRGAEDGVEDVSGAVGEQRQQGAGQAVGVFGGAVQEDPRREALVGAYRVVAVDEQFAVPVPEQVRVDAGQQAARLAEVVAGGQHDRVVALAAFLAGEQVAQGGGDQAVLGAGTGQFGEPAQVQPLPAVHLLVVEESGDGGDVLVVDGGVVGRLQLREDAAAALGSGAVEQVDGGGVEDGVGQGAAVGGHQREPAVRQGDVRRRELAGQVLEDLRCALSGAHHQEAVGKFAAAVVEGPDAAQEGAAVQDGAVPKGAGLDAGRNDRGAAGRQGHVVGGDGVPGAVRAAVVHLQAGDPSVGTGHRADRLGGAAVGDVAGEPVGRPAEVVDVLAPGRVERAQVEEGFQPALGHQVVGEAVGAGRVPGGHQVLQEGDLHAGAGQQHAGMPGEGVPGFQEVQGRPGGGRSGRGVQRAHGQVRGPVADAEQPVVRVSPARGSGHGVPLRRVSRPGRRGRCGRRPAAGSGRRTSWWAPGPPRCR